MGCVKSGDANGSQNAGFRVVLRYTKTSMANCDMNVGTIRSMDLSDMNKVPPQRGWAESLVKATLGSQETVAKAETCHLVLI